MDNLGKISAFGKSFGYVDGVRVHGFAAALRNNR